MSNKPILFNTEMVEAIRGKRKTQTRRIAFPGDDLREFRSAEYPEGWWYKGRVFKSFDDFLKYQQSPRCQYKPGDVLWVRETWRPIEASSAGWCRIEYKAGGFESFQKIIAVPKYQEPWHPSIHMPKEAARIFLRVKGVRLEQLRSITDRDAEREGVSCFYPGTNMVVPETMNFIKVWDNTIKPAERERYGWDANPWVWVIDFEQCNRPDDWFDWQPPKGEIDGHA